MDLQHRRASAQSENAGVGETVIKLPVRPRPGWEVRKEGEVLFNHAFNTFYFTVIWKEGNVLFNHALNTFYFTVIWKEGRKCFI